VNRLLAVAVKELRQIARDPLTLAMLLGVPAAMLMLYGYALNFDVRHVRLAVQDLDRTAASRTLVETFLGSTYFERAADLPAGADLPRVTERRQAQAILVLPRGFGADLAAGRGAQVQLLLDGSDAGTATTILGYAQAVVQTANVRRLGLRLAPAYEPRIWYNPELESTQFLVPGLVGFILMLTAVVSTALSVVRERERGTLEQLRVTPLSPGTLIVGKTLPYLGISLVAAGLILLTARGLFGVEVRGSHLELLLVTLVYLAGALGFGLFVSSIADSQAMAFQIGAISSMLPAIFLSGFVFPIRSMPEPLQWLTYVVPARYYLVILRGIVLKGAALGDYLRPLAFLTAFAVVVTGIAWLRLVRQERG